MASMCRCWMSLVALIGLTCLSYSTAQFVVPEFSSQPEPLTYARPNSTVRLSCTVSSAATAIQCGYRRGPDANIRFVSVNTNIMTGVRCLSNGIEVNAGLVASPALLADYEFFCKAVTNTNFALIGSPFRVNIVEIRPFNDAGPSPVQKECLKGNKVQIECRPPHSVPPAEISFTVDGVALTPLDRYRVVRLSTGSAALIIGKVLLDDGGKRYGCLATNPVTRQTVQSRVETLLIVKHAVAPRSPITVAAPAPREITLTEGDNATYSCITESSPIAEVSYLRDSGRRQLPASATELREFGLLQFTGIGLADQGAYACRVSYRPDLTSSGHMRDEKKLEVFNIAVKPKLSIAVKPSDVVLRNTDAIGSFICRVVGSNRRKPLWFNNGRLIDPSTSSDFSIQAPASDIGTSSLIVRRFDPGIRGVVQCVASGDKNQWESASALLLLDSDTVAYPPSPTPPPPSPPPPRPPVELASSGGPAGPGRPPVSGALVDGPTAGRPGAAAASTDATGSGGVPDAEPRINRLVSTPTAEYVGYNMVVNISWSVLSPTLSPSSILYFSLKAKEILPAFMNRPSGTETEIHRTDEPKQSNTYLWHHPRLARSIGSLCPTACAGLLLTGRSRLIGAM
ncbi:hypothetical protein BOX15_Mlig026790g1 [Macrostomum lignano]|uniref:Ig-like domain-containing protein n=1 Tax=Macrostomum lignano TaxID=282301 RepID=A0A267DM59_9PLAT|nr:hypothetical protein BOX15_Mlig026790g1 [Macrostomum lignano]